MKSSWLLAACVESLFVRVPGKREDSNLDFYLGFQKDPQASWRPLDYFGLLPFVLMSPESDLNCWSHRSRLVKGKTLDLECPLQLYLKRGSSMVKEEAPNPELEDCVWALTLKVTDCYLAGLTLHLGSQSFLLSFLPSLPPFSFFLPPSFLSFISLFLIAVPALSANQIIVNFKHGYECFPSRRCSIIVNY